MAKTKKMTVNTTPSAIIAQTYCRSIRLLEDPSVSGWPTTDLLISAPSSTDDKLQVPAGQAIELRTAQAIFPASTTVGYISTVAGSTTVTVVEDTT